MSEANYEVVVRALGHMIYDASTPEERPRRFEHFYENSLDAVPDMLARLGVMAEEGMGHVFCDDWDPAQPLNCVRHAYEPTLEDLGCGLDFLIFWHGATSYFGLGRSVHQWPQQALVKAALLIGRGILIERKYCPHDERGEAVIQDYYANRSELVTKIGDEALLFPEKKP